MFLTWKRMAILQLEFIFLMSVTNWRYKGIAVAAELGKR